MSCMEEVGRFWVKALLFPIANYLQEEEGLKINTQEKKKKKRKSKIFGNQRYLEASS